MCHYALEKQGARISECLLKRTWLPRVMKSSKFQYEEFDPEDEELEIEEDYEGLDEDEAREKEEEYTASRDTYAKEVRARNASRLTQYKAGRDMAEIEYIKSLAKGHAALVSKERESAEKFCGTIFAVSSRHERCKLDMVELYKLLQNTNSLQKTANNTRELLLKQRELLNIRQRDNETLAAYKIRFKKEYREAESMGVKIQDEHEQVVTFIDGMNERCDAYKRRIYDDLAMHKDEAAYPDSIDEAVQSALDLQVTGAQLMTKDDFKSMYAAMQTSEAGGGKSGKKSGDGGGKSPNNVENL